MEQEEQKPPEEPHPDEPREGSLPPDEESAEPPTPDPEETGHAPEGESSGEDA
jgi:hypothetical protein